MPLAVYCLYLSHLNGRSTPTLIAGSWDFGALLLGLSGFLVLSGPLFITLINSTWRALAYGGWANLRSIGRGEALAGTIMATGYFLILLGLIPLLVRSRRRVTAIYNVNVATVEPALVGVLDDLGYPWKREQGALLIGPKPGGLQIWEGEASAEPAHVARQEPRPPKIAHWQIPTDTTTFSSEFPYQTATVRIDQFPATGHATLKWSEGWRGVRPEVEPVLFKALTAHSSSKSSVASWTFTAALAIMIVMLLWLVVLIFLMMTPAPR